MSRKILRLILITSILHSITACNNKKSDQTTTTAVITSDKQFNDETSKYVPSPDLDLVLFAIKHSSFPDLIKNRKYYDLRGDVIKCEVYKIHDPETLGNMLTDIVARPEDRTETYKFNKDGNLVYSNRFKSEIEVVNKFNENNIPTKQTIINDGKKYQRLFHYDDNNRLSLLSDENDESIIEWSYENKGEYPLDIRLYRRKKLKQRIRLTWNNDLLIEKEKIGYNPVARNGILYRELEEFNYNNKSLHSVKLIKIGSRRTVSSQKLYYDENELVTNLTQFNIDNKIYSITNYIYDDKLNLIQTKQKADINFYTDTFGVDQDDIFSRKVEGPLELLGVSNYKYDKYNNIIENESPQIMRNFDQQNKYIPEQNNKTYYKYKYDKFGNWVEKLKLIEGEISMYWKREIEYY